MKQKPTHKIYGIKKIGKINVRIIERLYIGSTMLWINWSNATIVDKLLEIVKTLDEFNLYQNDLTSFLGSERFNLIKGDIYRKLRNVSPTQALDKSSNGEEAKLNQKVTNKIFEYISVPAKIIYSTPSSTKISIIDHGQEHTFLISTDVPNFPSHVSLIRIKDKLIIDEYWLYKHCKLYKVESEYIFRVRRSSKYGKSTEYVLSDKLGHEQMVISRAEFNEGDKIICKVGGFRKKQRHKNTLVLTDARLYESASVKPNQSKSAKPTPKKREYATPAPYYPNDKQPEAWFREVEGLGKHTATCAFKCSCCGRNFSTRQGCKIEFRDIYFCKACADQIFKHEKRGYIQIVYTPMGNKR